MGSTTLPLGAEPPTYRARASMAVAYIDAQGGAFQIELKGGDDPPQSVYIETNSDGSIELKISSDNYYPDVKDFILTITPKEDVNKYQLLDPLDQWSRYFIMSTPSKKFNPFLREGVHIFSEDDLLIDNSADKIITQVQPSTLEWLSSTGEDPSVVAGKLLDALSGSQILSLIKDKPQQQ